MTVHPPGRIGRRLASGAGLLILLRVVDRLIGLLSFSITARLLQREDFGVFALAISILAVIELFSEAGIDIALIQRRTVDQRLYDTAWTIKILTGATVALALCAAAVPASRFFGTPVVAAIMYWLALASVVGGFENIGTVDFLRSLNFGRDVLLRLGVRVIATAVGLTLAFAWRDYWALVAGHVAGKVALVLLSFVMHPFRPRPSLAEFGSLFAFTKWMLFRNVLQGLNDHAATFVIGRSLSVGALAYYSLARDVAGIATTDLQAPIRRALFPGYAAMSEDLPGLKRTFLDSVAMMVLLGLAIPVGLAAVAPEAVRVVFGERWRETAPLLRILALSGILNASGASVLPLLLAMGRPRVATNLAALRAIVLLPLLGVGAMAAGVHGVAWGSVASGAVMWAVGWILAQRVLRVSPQEALGTLYRPVVAAAVMTLAVRGLLAALPVNDGFGLSLVRLGLASVIGAMAYGLSVLVVWRVAGRPEGAERHVMDALAAIRDAVVARGGRRMAE